MIRYIRALGRLFIFGTSITLGMSLIVLSSMILGKSLKRSMRIRRAWIRFINPVLGLDILRNEQVPHGVYLYVSNHRSFIDPVVVLQEIFALPLAKAEVNSYPLIGYGARLTGILYVLRESQDSRLDARQAIATSMIEGWSVLIYPEGTTEITPVSGTFKKGSFEIASLVNTPIVPIAIEYQDPKDHWKHKKLFSQYLYTFGKKKCTCRLEFGEPIYSEDATELLQQTQSWIDQRLLQFRDEFDRK